MIYREEKSGKQKMDYLRAFGDGILQLLYPRVCPVCRKLLKRPVFVWPGADSGRDLQENPYLCPSCYEQLRFPREPRCGKCSRSLRDDHEEFCRDCLKRTLYFDQGRAAFFHADPVKKILYDLKYSNQRDFADMLAYEAVTQLAGQIIQWNPDVMVPVPLHKKRELARGFNQSELLARKFSRFLKERHHLVLPVDAELLFRVKQTRPQKELDPEERDANIRDAFAVRRPGGQEMGQNSGTVKRADTGWEMYRKILLVDDIYTTGATLSECARVLKQAGARQVYFLTFSIV